MPRYEDITAKCRSINEEREGLIDLKRKLTYELQVIEERLQVLDESLEQLYDEQEDDRPDFIDKQMVRDELVKAYFQNPGISQKELSDLFSMSINEVSKKLTKYFKQR